MPTVVIGIIVTLLGLSFAYRFYRACILGKVNYWAGFLPITIVSPFLFHAVPPPSPAPGKRSTGIHPVTGKRSLIREAAGLWVHLIMGPLFLILSVLFLSAGCDLMGLPGTDTLNYVLNGGNKLAPMAVTYDKRYTFQFPLFVRALKKFGKRADGAQIPLPSDKKLLRDEKPEYFAK
jgi:hypothetical protein